MRGPAVCAPERRRPSPAGRVRRPAADSWRAARDRACRRRPRPSPRNPVRWSWWQSRNRQSRASTSISANARSSPSSASHSDTARKPGRVEQHATRSGAGRVRARRSCADRGDRPRAPPTSPARHARRAGSRASTCRRPTRRSARRCDRGSRARGSASTPSPVTALVTITGTSGAMRRMSTSASSTSWSSSAEVALREHDDGRGPALPRQYEFAFEPAHVRPVHQRLHHEDGVDVRGEHLRVGRHALARRARARTPTSGQHRDDRGSPSSTARDDDPVARGHAARAPDPSSRRSRRPGGVDARRGTAPVAVSTVAAPRSTRATRPGTPATVRRWPRARRPSRGHASRRRQPVAPDEATSRRFRHRASTPRGVRRVPRPRRLGALSRAAYSRTMPTFAVERAGAADEHAAVATLARALSTTTRCSTSSCPTS